jgi:hypothetical protein
MEFDPRPLVRLSLATAAGSLVAAVTLVTISSGGGALAVAKAAPLDEPETASMATLMVENRRVLSYPFEQVWPTAIRYLRVDRGYTVSDRDEEAGYVLFEFALDGGGRGNGSLEMFRTEDASGRPSVAVSVSTGAGPIHLPNTLLDGLAAKVREERGQPGAPPPKDKGKDAPREDEPDEGDVPLLPPAQEPGA